MPRVDFPPQTSRPTATPQAYQKTEQPSVFVPNYAKIIIKGEEVYVTDPTLKSVLALLKDARPILSKLMEFSTNAQSGDMIENMIILLADPDTFKGLCLCASACTTRPAEFFDNISISDAVVLIEALIEVVNWSSLQDLFRKTLLTQATIKANPSP